MSDFVVIECDDRVLMKRRADIAHYQIPQAPIFKADAFKNQTGIRVPANRIYAEARCLPKEATGLDFLDDDTRVFHATLRRDHDGSFPRVDRDYGWFLKQQMKSEMTRMPEIHKDVLQKVFA